ncbi:hypothetical protein D5S17_10725 [Pseudonocardiaceae bacterium YIM PH 21723]|nr:hypothetical protein D5S17_10725 [Pseudonocardiaceae bacterium YIM PH 21723]
MLETLTSMHDERIRHLRDLRLDPTAPMPASLPDETVGNGELKRITVAGFSKLHLAITAVTDAVKDLQERS